MLSPLMILTSTKSEAQVNYAHVSARMGLFSNGVSARFYSKNTNGAFENMLAIEHGYAGFSLTSLYEEQLEIKRIPGLSCYAGAGMHAGYKCAVPNTLNGPDPDLVGPYDPKMYDNSIPGRFLGGVDAILGIDYHFRNSGFHISADVKPFVTFPNKETVLWDAALKIGVDL